MRFRAIRRSRRAFADLSIPVYLPISVQATLSQFPEAAPPAREAAASPEAAHRGVADTRPCCDAPCNAHIMIAYEVAEQQGNNTVMQASPRKAVKV